MGYTSRQKSFIDQYSANYLANAGITRDDLRQNSANGLALREAYNKALAASIASNPQIFESDQIDIANMVKTTPLRALDSFNLGDAADVFFTEVEKQSGIINPFSELNISKTYIFGGLVLVTAAAAIAYKYSPKLPQK